MAKSNDNLKPIFKDYLTLEQALQFLNLNGLLNYSITDLYELAVEEKVASVFLVDDIDVGYLVNNISEFKSTEESKHREWFRFSGYCQLDAKSFNFLYTSNHVLLINDLIVYKPIKPKFVPKGTEIELTKNDSLRVQPIERTLFDDSQEQVRGLPTGDYINHYAVHLKDIRFPVIELEQLIISEGKSSQNDLTDKKEQTYLLLIGILHYLLNEKKGKEDAPYKTKDALVNDIIQMKFETTGVGRSNVNEIIKDADEVYEDLKEKN